MITPFDDYLKAINTFSIDGKRVDVSNYIQLTAEIPDRYLYLESKFEKDQLPEVYENYEPYLKEYGVFPIIEVLGGSVICVGYEPGNEGVIYYHSFDFGLFELDKTIRDFVSKII